MSNKNIFLIDASSFCYRAFFAIKELSTSYGQPTNAIYGFLTMLNKILKERKPDYMAICFDVSKDTFRQRRFKEYKIHRPPMPDRLSSQIPIIEDVIKGYNLTIFSKEGFEADDIIATLSEKARQKNLDVFIISGDKDILQLVDKNVFVYNPSKDIVFNRQKVEEYFGVSPEKINELIALMGDATDNIPGVKGIGQKTAISLINEFGSLDSLLNNISKVKSEKLRTLLNESKDIIKLSRELAILKKDVDLDFELDKIKVREPDNKILFDIFKRLEFKSLVKEISYEDQSLPKPRLDKIDSREKANVALKDILDKKEIAISPHPSPCLPAGRLSPIGERVKGEGDNRNISYATSNEYNELLVCLSKEQVFSFPLDSEQGKKILSDENLKKICHDLKSIKLNLRAQGLSIEGISFDTMIASYLLNPAKADYSLEECAFDYLGLSLEDRLSPSVRLGVVFQLKEVLEERLGSQGLIDLFKELEMPLVDVLAEMEINGVAVDQKALTEISSDLEKRQDRLLKEVFTMTGEEFNLNSPKQLSQILFQKLNIQPIKRTKTGFSTNEEVLRQLSKKYEICKIILDYREIAKLKSTYADGLLKLCDKKTGKLHTSFIQTGTQTGRLSSREPNLQNIPIRTELGRGIRKVFIPSSGCTLLSADYSQIELRVLAHISGDDNLIKAFLDDKDIHKTTASLIYNVQFKDVTDEMRAVAKTINFGISYGMSVFGLSQELGITQEEAGVFIDSFFLRYPKVKEFMQSAILSAQKNGFVTTLLGRRRYLEGINNNDTNIRQFAQRQAINTPIQGTAADIIKKAMLAIHQEFSKNKLSSKMILQVHDELLFDVLNEELDRVKKIVKENMESALKLCVPLKVNIKIGKNWLEMEEI